MIPEDRLILTGRSILVTPALRTRVRTSLERALRRVPRVLEVHVLLSVEGKLRHICEVIVHLRATTLACRSSSKDLYTSIRGAAAKMERLAGKKREIQGLERRRASKKRKARVVAVEPLSEERPGRRVPPREPAPEAEPAGIWRAPFTAPRALQLPEAEAEVRRSAEGVIVYRTAETGRLQVLYRRPDGSLGLIDTGVRSG